MTKLNVLVYNGSGVSIASQSQTMIALRSFLSHSYDIQLISPKSIKEDPWMDNCALLVIPGGRDLPYHHDLFGSGSKIISDFVKNGGNYLGICAGGYFGCDRVEFEIGSELEVIGDRELKFFKGICRGTAFPGFQYETELGAREVVLELDRSVWRNYWSQSEEKVTVWYNGGGIFELNEKTKGNVQVIGRYDDLPNKPIAGVKCLVEKGIAILWAIHLEHPTIMIDNSLENREIYEMKERSRLALWRATLVMLELDVSESPTSPPQLLPLFLTSPDSNLLNSTIEALSAVRTITDDPNSFSITARHDTFIISPSTKANEILSRAKSTPGTSDVEELQTTPKEIICCVEGIPNQSLTPLFDLNSYFTTLHSLTTPLFGNLLLYGETVTSTQTLLDKNDKFLSALPNGLICLASHQIAGRGRGTNSWVSPAGCLQFSLVLRLPMTKSSKIVFIQYLFGLAVVESVKSLKGYEKVGIKLKWPNDIYGDLGNGELKKIGGILVNSSFAGDEFSLVVGCGVNTSNPKPTTSVNELISLHNRQTGSNLSPISQETLLALIIAQFTSMWSTFVEEGFTPFLDRYLSAWIHSDQRVTIESTKQVVRIVGITPEHGLLRTILVDTDRYGKEVFGGGRSGKPTFIDLQPDGNGFDMLKQLLVSRS